MTLAPVEPVMPTEPLARQFLSYAAIGLANTLIHLGVVILLVELGGLRPAPANGLAFACANLFSFWANSRFTFRARGGADLRRYARFLAVSLAGLGLALATGALGEWLRWHYLAGALLLFAVLPAITFVLNRGWTWRAPGA